MKKLFTLMSLSLLLFSCSQDSEVADMQNDDTTALNLEEQVASGLFDKSSFGIYEGTFTTIDGKYRSTFLLEIDGKNKPLVTFGFPDGSLKSFRTNEKAEKGQAQGMKFEGENFSFNFNVNADGSNPTITDMTYMGAKGDVFVLKETSKAPVTVKTGEYFCETGCFTDPEDTNPHPELGAPGSTQSFNFTLQGTAGNSDIFMQVALNSRVYTGTATQENCANYDGEGLYQRCGLRAQPDLNGNSGPIRFRSNVSETASQARHIYRADGAAYSCSSYEGTAYYDSFYFGRSTLSFQTDDDLENGGDCFNL